MNRNIMNQIGKLADERLNFMDGIRLGDVDIAIEDGDTVRKVRRIVEKRVCQQLSREKRRGKPGRRRFDERHRQSNQLRSIYGFVPKGFQYCSAA